MQRPVRLKPDPQSRPGAGYFALRGFVRFALRADFFALRADFALRLAFFATFWPLFFFVALRFAAFFTGAFAFFFDADGDFAGAFGFAAGLAFAAPAADDPVPAGKSVTAFPDDPKQADQLRFSDPAVWKFGTDAKGASFLELAYDRKKYQQSERGLVFTANIARAVVVAAVGALAMVVHAWWVGGAAIAWALVQLILTFTLRQRTRLGAERAAQWEGVEHFLRDFSELEEAPSGHLVLWERYLVYAVALGVSEELVRGRDDATVLVARGEAA